MVCTMHEPGFYSGPTPRVEHFLVIECRQTAAACSAAANRLNRTIQRHPPDQRRAPAAKPAARLLPALVMPFASWITWLDGVTRRASGRMCGLPPAIVSASWRERQIWPFRGLEYRSYPLPLDHRFSPLLGQNWAPKQRFRHRLPRHLPASPYGPLMVELFTFPFSRGIPGPGQVRLRLSPA